MAKLTTKSSAPTHRRRVRCAGVAVATASLLLAACSDDESAATPSPPAPNATAMPAASGTDTSQERIPDGTYRRQVTPADGEALGLDPEFRYTFNVMVPMSCLTDPSAKYWNPYVAPASESDHNETLIREFVIAACTP